MDKGGKVRLKNVEDDRERYSLMDSLVMRQCAYIILSCVKIFLIVFSACKVKSLF